MNSLVKSIRVNTEVINALGRNEGACDEEVFIDKHICFDTKTEFNFSFLPRQDLSYRISNGPIGSDSQPCIDYSYDELIMMKEGIERLLCMTKKA